MYVLLNLTRIMVCYNAHQHNSPHFGNMSPQIAWSYGSTVEVLKAPRIYFCTTLVMDNMHGSINSTSMHAHSIH